MSKTLNLINAYLYNEDVEMGAEGVAPDATDIAEQPEQAPEESTSQEKFTPQGKEFLVGLILQAFFHDTDESGLRIISELQAEFKKADNDPAKLETNVIIGSIMDVLATGNSSTKAVLDEVDL